MENREKKVLVIGVIGADVHAVGNKILYHAFTEAGFEVVNLGVMVSQEEYIAAAIESNADAIVVSSLYGQGELDCRGMREKCDEAGLSRLLKMWRSGLRLWASIGLLLPALPPKPPSKLCVNCYIWTVSRLESCPAD